MLSTQDFAQRVWVSLEDIRERLAVLETEAKHARCQLRRLEESLAAHREKPVAEHHHTAQAAGQFANPAPEAGNGSGSSNGASVTIRLNRKMLSGGVAGSLVAVVLAAGKALGWW